MSNSVSTESVPLHRHRNHWSGIVKLCVLETHTTLFFGPTLNSQTVKLFGSFSSTMSLAVFPSFLPGGVYSPMPVGSYLLPELPNTRCIFLACLLISFFFFKSNPLVEILQIPRENCIKWVESHHILNRGDWLLSKALLLFGWVTELAEEKQELKLHC